MIKDIGAFVYLGLVSMLNIIPNGINELILMISLLIGIALLLVRIYSHHLDIVIKRKKIKEDKKLKGE